MSRLSGENHPRFRDISGQRFGRLVAIKDSGIRKNPGEGVIWECQCDCGNIVNVARSSLIYGGTRSCGCLQKEVAKETGLKLIKDLTGKRVGTLTVLRISEERDYKNRIKWVCRCDCGKEYSVLASCLQSGKMKSCGCKREEVRLKKIRTEEFRNKQREISTKTWDESAKHIGMQDDTNISLIKGKNARIDSSTGYRGVYKKKNKYMCMLTFQKVRYSKYGFDTIEEAVEAREKMYKEIVVPYLESIGRE